ncbi:hypothetical protein Droror1_Dr00020133 [Drosera rotundifolia]
MVQKLEAIKGGGSSIKVGTVGTISSLMMRELDSVGSNSRPHLPSRFGSPQIQNPVAFGSSSFKGMTTMEEASSSNNSRHKVLEKKLKTGLQSQDHITMCGTVTLTQQKQKASREETRDESKSMNWRSPELPKYKRTLNIPMLVAEDMALDKTPNREKHVKKGYNVVGVVDIGCGSPSGSLANRLKKLGFSKLSETFI